MGHPIPKELKGEERYFSIPYLNLHFNRKGIIYNGIATAISVFIGKVTTWWIFVILFLGLNSIAYPAAHMKVKKNKFEGGYLGYDIYYLRMLKYKKFNQNVYIRRLKK